MKSVHEEVMPCDVFIERITDYMEEAMPARQRARFEQHLAFCPGCVTILEQMRSVARTLAAPEATVALASGPPEEPPTPVSGEAPSSSPASATTPDALKPALAEAFGRWKASRGLP
jgi:anti-sigma factor RsiW